MPKTIKVHVTYGDSKRILSIGKGEKVGVLRYGFLRDFSDVLSDDIAPINVKFKQYDDSFKDYVDLNIDDELNEDIAVQASTSKQTTSPEELECHPFWPQCMFLYPGKCRIPWIDLVQAQPVFSRFHKIKPNVNYRLWNPVSRQNDSLIQFDSNTLTVSCNGSFSQGDATAVFTIDEGTRSNPSLVGLTFVTATNGSYAITGNGTGNDVTVTGVDGPLDKKCIFKPLYYWSYTMFKNIRYNSYLACADNTGKLTLVTMDSKDFPTPQVLFIANKFSPTTSIS